MENKRKIRLGISAGDLNGIGVEILLKTFKDSRMFEFCTPVVYASQKVINFNKKHFDFNINVHSASSNGNFSSDKLNVVDVWKDEVNIKFGVENTEIGSYAVKSLEAAVDALNSGEIDVLVTAPINKKNIQSEAFTFPGHTDYLAQRINGNSLMLMVSGGLRVGLLTDHVPVKDISNKIDKTLIENKVQTVIKTLKQDFQVQKPKVALLAINPHAGDNGVIGDEDTSLLAPVIASLKEEGNLVFGPYPADSFFGSDLYKKFDAIIASYHDQGLIPFKTLSFGQGVNFTAGLDKIRTSPDHGTAFEIAGKGEANESSFKEAVFLAIKLYQNRKQYIALTSNVLKKSAKKA
jgi:4-hydroxythreonine-4-phosphate dehydrogenase